MEWILCILFAEFLIFFGIEILLKKETGNKETEEISEIHVGEIVCTKGPECVLDIGWVESLFPLKICAPYSIYKFGNQWGKRYYGAPSKCKWHGTGKYITSRDWEKISTGKSAREICWRVGIPYYWRKEESNGRN